MIKDKIFAGLGAISVYMGIDGLVYANKNHLSMDEAKMTVDIALDAYVDIMCKAGSYGENTLELVKDNVLSIPELWPSLNYVFATPNIVVGASCLTLGGYWWYKNRN